jgi:hypothetical protein
MCNITPDKSINFKDRTKECGFCDDGKQYIYTETCKTCNDKKKLLKGTRLYKCKTCNGKGYTFLANKIYDNVCYKCNGTQRLPLTAYDNITDDDREWIFKNLFNFDKPYTGNFSTFNEGFIAAGIVCGVTDYGRYQHMKPAEFREEVRKNFMDGYMQYVSILNKATAKLPSEILIRKGESGWFAYSVYSN